MNNIRQNNAIGESIGHLNEVMDCITSIMNYHLKRDGYVPVEVATALSRMLDVVAKRVKQIAHDMQKSEEYQKVFDQIEKALSGHDLLRGDENDRN